MCRVRRPDEAEGEWGLAKHNGLEECFANEMKKKLKADHGFQLDFNLVKRCRQYADAECAACGYNTVRYNHVCPNK